MAGLGIFLESTKQTRTAALDEDVASFFKEAMIHPGQEMDIGPCAGSLALRLGEAKHEIEMADAALAKERIFHHVRQRRRDGQRQFERRAFRTQFVEELDERNVRFGDGLEEPAFLQKAVILGMTHVGQMSVQNEKKIALRHERISLREVRENGSLSVLLPLPSGERERDAVKTTRRSKNLILSLMQSSIGEFVGPEHSSRSVHQFAVALRC